MKRDIVIIGAGPAGIFTAIEMLRHGCRKDIVIVEKGAAIENRSCPKTITNKCMNCKPYCHITTGFSGAGAFFGASVAASCTAVAEGLGRRCSPAAGEAGALRSAGAEARAAFCAEMEAFAFSHSAKGSEES